MGSITNLTSSFMTLTYRLYEAEDITQITRVEDSAFHSPQTPNQLETLAKTASVSWVAEQDGHIVGFIMARAIADEAELLNIAVSPSHQGSTVAYSLLNHVKDMLRLSKTKRCFLEVRESNERAIRFYHRNDFAKVGVRVAYYQNTDSTQENAVLMACNL